MRNKRCPFRRTWIHALNVVTIQVGACFGATTVFAQTSNIRLAPDLHFEERLQLPKVEPDPPAQPRARFQAVMELRSVRNQMPDRNPQSIQNLNELGVNGDYQIERNLSARVNLSFEKWIEETKFYIKEAFFTWRPFDQWAELRAGQQLMRVGLFNRMDNFFSWQPAYVDMLFTSTKGIDLGAELSLYPWKQKWIYLELGQYAGQVLREQDQRRGSPHTPPRFISLKSDHKFYEAFVTYFEHHLDFYNPIRAVGLGGELRAPQEWVVRPRLVAEFWTFSETQTVGPIQRNQAASIFGAFEWWKLGVGVRWSHNSIRMISRDVSQSLAPQRGSLTYLEAIPVQPLRLRIERSLESQQLQTRQDWTARAILTWNL